MTNPSIAGFAPVPTTEDEGPVTIEPLSVETGDTNVSQVSQRQRIVIHREDVTCCCCDVRRAVVGIDAFALTTRLLDALLVARTGASYLGSLLEDVASRSEATAAVHQFESAGGTIVLASFVVVVELALALGLASGVYGALYCRAWGVALAGAAYTVLFVLEVLAGNAFGMIGSCLCLYPHWRLHSLLRKGLVTLDNYHWMTHCCGRRRAR